jgi:hypothetical protein
MRRILTSEFVQNNNNAKSGFTLLKRKRDGLESAKKGGGIILRLLKGRGMVSGLFEKKRDAIPPHPAPPQALGINSNVTVFSNFIKTNCTINFISPVNSVSYLKRIVNFFEVGETAIILTDHHLRIFRIHDLFSLSSK